MYEADISCVWNQTRSNKNVSIGTGIEKTGKLDRSNY